MTQFMIMSLATYNSENPIPDLVEGADAYDVAAQRAVDQGKSPAQYIVYTMKQWAEHKPGHAVTVEITGQARAATFFPTADRPHPRDVTATTKRRVLDRTPPPEPEPEEPEIPATPRKRRAK